MQNGIGVKTLVPFFFITETFPDTKIRLHNRRRGGIHFTMSWERGVNMELKVFRDTISAAGRFCMVKSEIPIETEILISDYLPQVFKIIKCSTKMVLLQKKLQPGRLLLEGYLRCVVYYQGEGEVGLCQTEQKVPFSKTMEIPVEDFAGWSAAVGGEAEYLNCRAVHQRRIEIRGAWELSASVYPQTRQEVVCAVAGAGTAQKQSTVRGVRNVGCVDKLVTADAVFSFEQEPESVLDIAGTAQLREQNVMQGRLSVKGEISAQLSYRVHGSGQLLSQRVMVPFVQTMELDDLSEDCQCFCVVEPTGFTLQTGAQQGKQSTITASVLLHLRVFRSYAVDVVQECFATGHHVNVEQIPLAVEQLESAVDERQTVSAKIALPGDSVQILSCLADPAVPELLNDQGKLCLRVRTQLSIIYKNSMDELECRDGAAELTLPMDQVQADAELHSELWVSVDNMNCILNAESAEVSASLHIEGLLLRSKKQPVLLNVELGEAREKADPEIVLRACYVQPGEQVFDVARRFHVLPTRIMQANGLTEDAVPAGTCLLIPCTE